MEKIKAIIFDLDKNSDRFHDNEARSRQVSCKSHDKNGLKLDERESYRKLMITYLKLGIESDIAFQEFLKNELGKIDEKMLAAAINAYLKTKSRFLKPYPNVKPTLRELKRKGFQLAIVTDAPKVKAYQRLLAMDIEKYFDFIIGFEDTGKRKKTELPLRMAIEKLQLNPEEVMTVGDSIKRDVIPAKKLNMKTVLAKYGSEEKVNKIKPDLEISEIKEILHL